MTKRIASIMDTRGKKAGMIVTCLVLLLALGTGFILAASPTQAQNATENTVYNTGNTEEITNAEQNPSTQNTEAENNNNSNTTQTQPIASETTDNKLTQPTENEITMFSLQPGLIPGERELEQGESWPLTDNHMIVELFDNDGDVGVRHSADGGETWVESPAFITLGDDVHEQMTEQERAAWFSETPLPPTPTTRNVDFNDIENMVGIVVLPPPYGGGNDLMSEEEVAALLDGTAPPRTINVDFGDIENRVGIYVISPNDIGEVFDFNNDPEIQAMIQAGATMQEIFAALLERR